MTVRFSAEEVVKATGAQVTRRGKVAAFTGVCTDTRALTPGCLFVALKGERFDAHDFLDQAVAGGAAAVMVEDFARAPKNEAATVFAVTDTLVGLGRLANAHRSRFNIPIVAVTGSNGKTTTKELVGSILSTRGPALKTAGNLNNEIGVPLTLFNLDETHVAAVIEMGMNHAGEIGRLTRIARPDAGLITIVQPAHLEGVGSIEGVAAAKAELFWGLAKTATAVVNVDDARIVFQAEDVPAKKLTWGRTDGADVRLVSVEPRGRDGQTLKIAARGSAYTVALNLVGDHNANNATGAFALALSIGYSPEECVKGLESAHPHSRRLQIVDAPNGVTVVDDCYNANPSSMTAALKTVADLAKNGRAVAVLGDMLELGSSETREHTDMGPTAASLAALVAFFGPRMKHAHAEAVKTLGDKARHFEDVPSLVAWLTQELKPNDYVLVKGSRGMKLERVVEALTGTSTGGGH